MYENTLNTNCYVFLCIFKYMFIMRVFFPWICLLSFWILVFRTSILKNGAHAKLPNLDHFELPKADPYLRL